MAVRRMIHAQIINSDAFLSLPFSSQMLYVHITMAADDDGFCNGAERLARTVGCRKADLQRLTEKRFLLRFGDVVVVKHWRMANSLKNDRLKPFAYPDIAKQLYVKPNRAYTDHPAEGAVLLSDIRLQTAAFRNPSGIPREEKGKEDNRKEEKVAEAVHVGIPPEPGEGVKKFQGLLGKGVLMLSEAQTEDLLTKMGLDAFDYYTDKLSDFILQKGAKVKNHYGTLLRWWEEDCRVEGGKPDVL